MWELRLSRGMYFEFECTNPDCENKEVWEVYGKMIDWGDGSYDITPMSDDPTGYKGSTECESCGKTGELI